MTCNEHMVSIGLSALQVLCMSSHMMLWGNLRHAISECICRTPRIRCCGSAIAKKDPPNALETASTPPTLHVPAHTTTPPALSIRCRSSVRLGLWSSDRGKAAQHKNPCQDNVSQRPRRALLLMLMHAGTGGVCSTTDTAATVMLTSYLNHQVTI